MAKGFATFQLSILMGLLCLSLTSACAHTQPPEPPVASGMTQAPPPEKPKHMRSHRVPEPHYVFSTRPDPVAETTPLWQLALRDLWSPALLVVSFSLLIAALLIWTAAKIKNGLVKLSTRSKLAVR